MNLSKRPMLALGLLLPAPSLGVLIGMWWLPGHPVAQLLFAICKLWILLLPLIWLRWVDKGRFSWSPLPASPHSWRYLAEGCISGVLLGAAVLALWVFAGDQLLDVEHARSVITTAGLNSPALYIGMAFYWSFINAALEEYVWRWFVVSKAVAAWGKWPGVIIGALGFALHHVLAVACYAPWPVALLAGLGVAIGGTCWSLLYLRHGSLWPAYLSHVIVDIVLFAIGYTWLFGP